MAETRKLAAILAADVVGYSRLAGSDEERTLARLRGLRSDLIDPAIAAHHGRVVKRTGDGVLIEFRSVVDAVRCAIEVQNGMVERNAGLPPERRIEFRIGIHLGDVVEESDALLNDLTDAIAKASEIVKSQCPTNMAFAPVERLVQMEERLQGLLQAVNISSAPPALRLTIGRDDSCRRSRYYARAMQTTRTAFVQTPMIRDIHPRIAANTSP